MDSVTWGMGSSGERQGGEGLPIHGIAQTLTQPCSSVRSLQTCSSRQSAQPPRPKSDGPSLSQESLAPPWCPYGGSGPSNPSQQQRELSMHESDMSPPAKPLGSDFHGSGMTTQGPPRGPGAWQPCSPAAAHCRPSQPPHPHAAGAPTLGAGRGPTDTAVAHGPPGPPLLPDERRTPPSRSAALSSPSRPQHLAAPTLLWPGTPASPAPPSIPERSLPQSPSQDGS